MSDDVQALVDRSGCPLGTRVNPAVTQKLHRLAAMLLADALGDPLDFLERPASYVRVFYWSGGQQVWLFWLAIDVVFHRVHLQVAGHRTQVLEPLTEPRHRLARKVDLFLQEVGAERLRWEGARGRSAFRPRRMTRDECQPGCLGGCFALEAGG